MTGSAVVRSGLSRLASYVAKRGLWLVVFALFVMAGAAAFLLPSTFFAALLVGAAVVLTWLVQPKLVILTLLLARSSLDGFMELFTLFSGTALSMNLSGAANSLAVGLGVLALARRVVRRQPLFPASPGWAYSLFLLVCLLSIPGSFDTVAAVKEWARLASGLAIYLLVAEVVHDEYDVRTVVVAIFVSSLIPLAMAWTQRLLGGGFFFPGFVGTQFAFRPQGTFAHPAMLGNYLVLLITLAAALYFSLPSRAAPRTPVARVLLILWAIVAGGCLILTLARAQWLEMLLAALILGLVKRRRLALGALLVTGGLLLAVPLLRERLLASDSVVWRLDLWQAGLQIAWPPTLWGRGLASSPWLLNQYLPTVETHPHNDYLKMMIELGIVGLLAYGFWLLSIVEHAWRAHRRALQASAEHQDIAWRSLALFSVIIAAAVVSVVHSYVGNTAVQWYLWAVVALVPRGGTWQASSASS